MSAFRKMPNEKRVRTLRYAIWFSVLVVALVLNYFQKHGETANLQIAEILVVIFGVAVIIGAVLEPCWSIRQRCPESGQSMREAYEDVHPKAEDYYLLYCDRCDIVWDTTFSKSYD